MEKYGNGLLNNITTCQGNDHIELWPCSCEPSGKNIVITSPADEWTNTNGQLQSQRKREARMIRPSAVSSLVRHLMAIERSRLLGSGAADLSRYAREKRTQRWREARKRFNFK